MFLFFELIVEVTFPWFYGDGQALFSAGVKLLLNINSRSID
jgi:hypothetical protein